MKIALGLLAVAGIAASANAAITATWEEIGSLEVAAPGPSVYLGTAGPYAAFAAANGAAGFDDYTTTQGSNFMMSQFVFVGGVTVAGGQMRFDFLDNNDVLLNSFTVTLGQGGDFIWTITLGSPADGLDSTFVTAPTGHIRATVLGTALGRWYLTSTAPTIGSNSFAYGTNAPSRNHAFEMRMAPTPGSLALLGLGGLAAARRRR